MKLSTGGWPIGASVVKTAWPPCAFISLRSKASGHSDGFVKLIFDAKYGELLGGHMIGANVTEMVAELVSIRKLETTCHEIIKTIHPHPTMSEAIMEAAAAAYDEVIHI